MVAQYFFTELKKLGIETEFMCMPDVDGNRVQLQQVVIGRIPGTDSTGSIAFNAHYDSVPYGPGATDDIAGCIAMLEAARAFKNQPPIRNDILFIFTDAEEVGGYGAHGFCDHHPLAKDIGIVTVMDVRGTKGPALMYETSSDNGTLIRELNKARAYGAKPITSSFMFDVYEASPFGSDFTKFRNSGHSGYSLAYIDKFMWYHTVNDSPEHVSPESIQHFGSHLMAVTKHFASTDFKAINLKTPNDIYFNTLGFNLVQYPQGFGTPLAVAAVALLLFVIILGCFLRRITIGGYIKSLLLFPVAALGSALIALAMFSIVFGYKNVVHLYTVKITYIPEPSALYDGNLYCYAFGLMALAFSGATYYFASRRLRVEELQAAAMTWLCPLLAVLVMKFSGGSYLAMWPILFGSLGLALLYFGKREEGPGPILLVAATLFAIPALCLLPPGWMMLMWMINILGAPVLAILVLIILANVMPAMALLGRVRRTWIAFPVMAVIAVLLLCTGLIISKPSKDRPLMNSVAYVANLDTQAAWWLSEDVKVDEWTKQFFPDGIRSTIDDLLPDKRGDHYLRGAAPVAEHLRGLRCDVLKDELVDGKRRLAVHVYSDDAPLIVRFHQVQGPKLNAVTVDSVPLKEQNDAFSMEFQILSSKGYIMTFETTPGEPIKFEAFSAIYGFPQIPGITPRPEYMVPEPNTLRNGISLRGEHIYLTNSVAIPAGV
jgi:hypothetical protein